MNHRDIFNKVKNHLLTQNAKAYDDACLYRTKDGKSCAVGCLINDEVYGSFMEGESPRSSVIQEALLESGIPIDPETISLLCKLQDIHDDTPVEQWKYELETMEAVWFGEDE